MSKTTPIIVVLGNGCGDKPHAARFDASELAATRKAAGLMGFRLDKGLTEPAQALARKLPEGKIFASGKGLLPLVKAELFEEWRPRWTSQTPTARQAARRLRRLRNRA